MSLLCSTLALAEGATIGEDTIDSEEEKETKPSYGSVWGYGLLCVTVISLMSIMGVTVLPFMTKSFYTSLLTGLIGLAVGSLTGVYIT